MDKPIAFAFLLLATPLLIHADPSSQYVEKRIGDRPTKLPALRGFSPACEENQQIAERAQLMTPKTSVFVTCFVESGKWRDFLSGRSSDLYPFIFVTINKPIPGGSFSGDEFEKLRSAAHAQLGDLLADSDATQQRLADQDRAMAASGIPVARNAYQQSLQGFFPTPGVSRSFSYIAIRKATVSEAGVTRPLSEANAVSTVLFGGRLLGLNVIDQRSGDAQGRQAQKITLEWLRAFRALNAGDGN